MNYHTLEDSLETTPTLPPEDETASERARSKSPGTVRAQLFFPKVTCQLFFGDW